MADSVGTQGANTALNALGTAYPWVQLHTGAPGAAGTTAVATNNTRKTITYASSTANSLVSSADAAWTAVSTTETYTHFSTWSASTSGNFGFSGAVTGGAVTATNNFTIASGSLTAAFTLAS